MSRLIKPKLYYVDGVKHSAVVLAGNKGEVVRLAIAASRPEEADRRVLYGHVDEWEAPGARELKLPRGYRLVTTGSTR